MPDDPRLIPLLSGLGTAIAGWFYAKRKGLEQAQAAAEAAYRSRIDSLEGEIASLRRQMADLVDSRDDCEERLTRSDRRIERLEAEQKRQAEMVDLAWAAEIASEDEES